jgi:aspartyl aminopeptidase
MDRVGFTRLRRGGRLAAQLRPPLSLAWPGSIAAWSVPEDARSVDGIPSRPERTPTVRTAHQARPTSRAWDLHQLAVEVYGGVLPTRGWIATSRSRGARSCALLTARASASSASRRRSAHPQLAIHLNREITSEASCTTRSCT